MKKLLITLLIGITIGSITTFLIMPRDKKIEPEKITVKRLYGEPSKVEKATAGKSSVSITEKHNGAGSSEIIIPYSEIPAANNWITKRKSASIYISPRGNLYGVGSYRYESIIFSIGLCVPVSNFMKFDNYDIYGGIGLWF